MGFDAVAFLTGLYAPEATTVVVMATPADCTAAESTAADPDLLTTTAVVNCWIDDLRERGAVLRLVDGSACMDWPADLDTPGRRRDFELHQAIIAKLLVADHDHGVHHDGGPTCPRCGGQQFRDTTIHAGESVRRDCATCGRFIDFTVWHGRRPAVV